VIRCLYTFIFLILISSRVLAQFYDNGQDPPSMQWRLIKTGHFHILYPKTIESKAQQLANMLEAAYTQGAASLNVLPKKITVILHPADVVSNAQVAWAPRRMEFITVPPQDAYPEDWIDQLAVHEYRHVVQITKVNKGFTHVLSWLFGEQIVAGIIATYVPFWFIEGDATLTETLLSGSGRGRVPSFDVELRAQLLEKGPYSYDKAVYGSYRDFVSDHYVLGYHMVTMARRDYGPQVFEKALNTVARIPVMITPFNHGIRKISGHSKVKLYKRYMHQLDSIWKEPLKTIELTPSGILTRHARKYTRYTHPALLSNGAVIAMRSGIDDIRRIVRIDSSGKTKILCTPGPYSDVSLSAAGNRIVWAELSHDPRWESRNYSIIRCYDAGKKHKYKLSHRSRYFSPALSPDAQKLVAAACDEKNEFSLVIIDASKGKLLRSIPAPSGCEIISPFWSDDGQKIVCILLGEKGKQLSLVTPSENKFIPLIPPSRTEISKPVFWGKWVVFSSALSGIDNIYAMDTATRKMFRITSVRYGAYDPCISADGKKLFYSDYTAGGNCIAVANLDTLNWESVEKVADISPHLYEPLLQQEKGIVSRPDSLTVYASKPYRKFLHLLNPHSWGPISVNANSSTIKPGLTLMTQNKLSTLFGTLGYEYNINEAKGTYFADVSFRQWYPVFDFRFEFGNRSTIYTDTAGQDVKINWKQTAWRASLRVPLNLSSGKWARWLQPRVSCTWMQMDFGSDQLNHYFIHDARILDYELYWSNQVLGTDRDIHPRQGQVIRLNYSHTPIGGDKLGNISAVQAMLYFPGIGHHHNVYLNGSWQKKSSSFFSDRIAFPRGFKGLHDNEYWTYSLNYTMPLVYPDLHVGSVFYLKRLWANLFFDHAAGSSAHKNIYRSAGMELTADIHILRFLAPFSIGGRLSWIPDIPSFVPEFLYSVNIDAIR
jgi:hypothetical protein